MDVIAKANHKKDQKQNIRTDEDHPKGIDPKGGIHGMTHILIWT